MLWGEKTSKGMKNDSLSFLFIFPLYSVSSLSLLWIIFFCVFCRKSTHTINSKLVTILRDSISNHSLFSFFPVFDVYLSAKKHIYYRKFCASAQRRFTPKDFVDSAPSWRIFHATFAFLLLKSQSMSLHSILIA